MQPKKVSGGHSGMVDVALDSSSHEKQGEAEENVSKTQDKNITIGTSSVQLEESKKEKETNRGQTKIQGQRQEISPRESEQQTPPESAGEGGAIEDESKGGEMKEASPTRDSPMKKANGEKELQDTVTKGQGVEEAKNPQDVQEQSHTKQSQNEQVSEAGIDPITLEILSQAKKEYECLEKHTNEVFRFWKKKLFTTAY